MRIAIDARAIEKRFSLYSIARIISNLLKVWVKDFPDNKYLLYCDDDEFIFDITDILQDPHVKLRIIKRNKVIPFGLFWEQIILPFHLLKDRVDLLLSPNYGTSLLFPGRKYVMVHDISYKALGEKSKTLMLMNIQSYLSCVLSSKIITISEYSRNEIVEKYSIDRQKVRVVYLGVEDRFRPLSGRQDIVKIDLDGKTIAPGYILSVCRIYNRRPMLELIRAYERLIFSDQIKDKLVIVGSNNTFPRIDYEGLINEINRKAGSEKIVYINRINEDQLLRLYQDCSVFVYPSTYEGFGLPVLEAMACGKPVITGNCTALPEIAGDGAMCIDVKDVDAVYKALKVLYYNKVVAAELSRKALKRAKSFAWKESAHQCMNIFR